MGLACPKLAVRLWINRFETSSILVRSRCDRAGYLYTVLYRKSIAYATHDLAQVDMSKSSLNLWQRVNRHQNLRCAKLPVPSALVVSTMTCVVCQSNW